MQPGRDVPIVYTGVRPGEKLFEELLTVEAGTDRTDFERLFVSRLQKPGSGLMDEVDDRIRNGRAGNVGAVLRGLKHHVPTYSAPEQAVEFSEGDAS
jgi:FlaA1/EpsC-like NDP-sugar epimerase